MTSGGATATGVWRGIIAIRLMQYKTRAPAITWQRAERTQVGAHALSGAHASKGTGCRGGYSGEERYSHAAVAVGDGSPLLPFLDAELGTAEA